ncbi:MAG: phosphatidylserine decarboxylase family protein [Fibrobacterota bacterium]
MAKEGLGLVMSLLVVIIIFLVGFLKSGSTAVFVYLLIAITLATFTMYFFRDPKRKIPQEPGLFVSPADGKVVEIVEDEHPYTGKARRVSIFLNVFNVHVNRVPAAGTVEYFKYYKGKFLAAWDHKASLDNEQSQVGLRCGKHKILVKQIAGLIARRIVCRAREGNEYARGERFGLIKFGSRTDLFLPLEAEVRVNVGDKVAGGSSIIAVVRE